MNNMKFETTRPLSEVYDTTKEIVEHNQDKVFIIDYNPTYYKHSTPCIERLDFFLNEFCRQNETVERIHLHIQRINELDFFEFTRFDEGSVVVTRTFDRPVQGVCKPKDKTIEERFWDYCGDPDIGLKRQFNNAAKVFAERIHKRMLNDGAFDKAALTFNRLLNRVASGEYIKPKTREYYLKTMEQPFLHYDHVSMTASLSHVSKVFSMTLTFENTTIKIQMNGHDDGISYEFDWWGLL
jgi:hypothetical protein